MSYEKKCYGCGLVFKNVGLWASHGSDPTCTWDMKFWGKVDRSAGPYGCWIWIALKDRHGYGLVMGRDKKNGTAHRMAWEIMNGPIASGLHVLHSCDNPACVNPAHLGLGTHKDNMREMLERCKKPLGERCNSNKLTEAQAIEIRALYRTNGKRGRTSESNAPELAAKYGVTVNNIHAVGRRRTWRYLNER